MGRRVWGWALWLVLGSAHADTVTDAVSAGRAAGTVDWSAVRANTDALGAVGDATGDTAAIEALRQNGQGVLFAPGRTDADACHDKTDPRCRAVQVVDRESRLPDAVDPDPSGRLMAGRDNVVAGADDRIDLEGTVSSAPGTCRPIVSTVTTPPETLTCEIRTSSTAGEQTTRTCEEKWLAIIDEASRWACSVEWFRNASATCSVPVEVPQNVTQTVSCLEGTKESTPYTCPVTVTTATASKWEAVCVKPVYVVTVQTCTEELVVSTTATCTPGQAVSAENVDAATLGEDNVTGLDRLKLSYTCEQSTAKPLLVMETNAAAGTAYDTTLSTRESSFDFSRVVHDDTWRVAGTTTCETSGACTSRVTMSVYKGSGTDHVFSGSLTTVLAFNRFIQGEETEHWITTCTEAP